MHGSLFACVCVGESVGVRTPTSFPTYIYSNNKASQNDCHCYTSLSFLSLLALICIYMLLLMQNIKVLQSIYSDFFHLKPFYNINFLEHIRFER